MRIRDALESDAEALATATGRPRDVVRNMIHDRSVRVAVGEDGKGEESDGNSKGEESDGDEGRDVDSEREGGTGDNNSGDGGDEETTVLGFVAFDVRDGTVHVTDFDGDGSTIERLFEEPRRFARREEMGVEVVVPNDEATGKTGDVIEASGFATAGRGPRFEGRPTTRYRIEFADLTGETGE